MAKLRHIKIGDVLLVFIQAYGTATAAALAVMDAKAQAHHAGEHAARYQKRGHERLQLRGNEGADLLEQFQHGFIREEETAVFQHGQRRFAHGGGDAQQPRHAEDIQHAVAYGRIIHKACYGIGCGVIQIAAACALKQSEDKDL